MEPIPVIPDPVVEDGIDYWSAQPASYDGVLGTRLLSASASGLTTF